jgi:benzoylformate decarboxylase
LPLPPTLRLIHLSPANVHVGRIYPVELGLVGDPEATLSALMPLLPEAPGAVDRLAEARRRQAERWATEDSADSPGERPESRMSPRAAVRTALQTLPPESTVVEEAPTSDPVVRQHHRVSTPDRFFYSRGGALGWGMGAALGLSLGRGRDRVTCIVGDGSAMYSPQALWTAARHRLPVLFVLVRNDSYLILRRFLERMKGQAARTGAYVGMDLAPPAIDFVGLSRSLGVEASSVSRFDDVADAVREGLGVDGPFLLELVVAGPQVS